jgi:hypothetical protein
MYLRLLTYTYAQSLPLQVVLVQQKIFNQHDAKKKKKLPGDTHNQNVWL